MKDPNTGEQYKKAYDGEMTFEEIALVLKTSKQNAWMLYRSAISKLRRRKITVRQLRELARSKDIPAL